jgi:hypothetical protein
MYNFKPCLWNCKRKGHIKRELIHIGIDEKYHILTLKSSTINRAPDHRKHISGSYERKGLSTELHNFISVAIKVSFLTPFYCANYSP